MSTHLLAITARNIDRKGSIDIEDVLVDAAVLELLASIAGVKQPMTATRDTMAWANKAGSTFTTSASRASTEDALSSPLDFSVDKLRDKRCRCTCCNRAW